MAVKHPRMVLVILVVGLAAALLLALVIPPGSIANASSSFAPALAPTGTGFSYQGYLENNGTAANGAFDLQFQLWDAALGGAQVGATITHLSYPVFEGLFTAELDFGTSVFGGGARWLQVGVRPGGSAVAYTALTPRQEITPAPSALSMPNVFTNEGQNFVGVGRDFRLTGNEVFGLRYTGAANDYGGMYVETSHAQGWPFYGYATSGSFRAWTYYNGTTSDWHLYNAGVRLTVPNEGGLRIGPSADYSLVISSTTGSDGMRIYDTGDDGIQIGSDPDYPNYGVYIPSPGVSAYGLWPNTSEPAGEWALFTVDDIEAGTVTAAAVSLVAQVAEGTTLEAGDVVSVMGLAPALPGGATEMAAVNLAAGPNPAGLAGVVASRMLWQAAPGKEAEGEMALRSVEGTAQAGEYVSIVVLGIAQVKVDPAASIAAGQRLTVSDLAGQARALRTQTIDGMVVAEGSPAIGVALEAPSAGQDTIAVFVTLR